MSLLNISTPINPTWKSGELDQRGVVVTYANGTQEVIVADRNLEAKAKEEGVSFSFESIQATGKPFIGGESKDEKTKPKKEEKTKPEKEEKSEPKKEESKPEPKKPEPKKEVKPKKPEPKKGGKKKK